MTILDIDQLTMRFGGLTAVNRVDLKIDPGRIASVIGPNGAGKTTVFNAVTGIYEPTEGAVRFEGRDLRKPFTWKVGGAVALIGILTGVLSLVADVNIDKLWVATIKRNYEPDQPFSYAAAGRGAWGYLKAELAVENRRGKWVVVTADGKPLGLKNNEADAQALKSNIEAMAALDGADRTIEARDGKAVVLSPDRARILGTFDSVEDARERLQTFADLGRKQAAWRREAVIALFVGLLLGTAGAYVVWNRARRTPDTIALGGIARTFQNIRLFQDMTVLENVLIGMDRNFRGVILEMALRLPRVRREERDAAARAMEMLDFVGLKERAGMISKNLPYGDQRRLEIARALATEPRLILLDEPAAGMNPSETTALMALIRKIRDRGITVVLIEHHMKVVMGISDQIAVLDYGVKIADGTPDAVRGDPKVIEAYLGKDVVE